MSVLKKQHFLNKEERDALLDEIKDKKFNQIKGRLLQANGARLGYFRNVQQTGKWMTRIILDAHGTQVTLVETRTHEGVEMRYHLQEIVVEPTSENRL